MNTNMAMDVDPLSTYDYSGYDATNYNIQPMHNPVPQYPYDVKVEQNMYNHHYNNAYQPNINEYPKVTESSSNNDKPQNNENETIKAEEKTDVKPVIEKKRGRNRNSNYMSQKIEKGFPFYGCAICNVNYESLQELDQHVTIHKDRITSYDLRIKNQIKRKKIKKAEKKLKKLGKEIKRENLTPDIPEIKPEDGYIGNKKAAEYNETNEKSNLESINQNKADKIDTKAIQESNSNDISKNDIVSNENQNETSSQDNETGKKKNKKEEGDKQSLLNLEKIYKCFACQKQFSLSYYLKLHVRSHTDEKPYICSVCGQSFITASKLGRHNKRIHLAIRYQCRVCYKFFSRFEFLTRHFDKKHPEDKLEGEPYDYNAILPYLKELEEQLREQAEAKEAKPKAEDIWPDGWSGYPESCKDEKLDAEKRNDQTEDIQAPMIEEVKLPVENMIQIEVKKEEDEAPEYPEQEDDVKHEMGDDSISDDDYFPSNTWAATPKIESNPPSPSSSPPRRKRKDGSPLKCKICEKTISSRTYMRVHMRTHTGERPFKCYICGRGFITSSKMHRHVLTHNESWEDDKVKEETEVKDEVAEPTDGDSETKKTKGKLAKKKKSDKKYQKREHACEYCQKRFLHKETLQVHKKSHEGEELVMKCNYCLMEFDDEGAMKTHEGTHEGPKPYLCTICGKSYKKRETMVYHRKNHKPDREFTCDICSKTFNASCKLQRHIMSHRVDKFVLRYECPVCAHMFNTKYHVQMHLATHQKEGLIMEENRNEILAMVLQNARKIPKQADAPANLTDIIPQDDRSRICNICGEIFQHFYYLEEHLKSHGSKIAIEDITKVEEKKHTCQVCNKSFKLHYYLKLHSFTHTKEKPYICQQCGKGFITKGKLKRHLETHTGLKKYQCHICYKFFTRPSYLRIHIRTIHGTQDYNFRLDKDYSLGVNPMSLNQLPHMSQISQQSV